MAGTSYTVFRGRTWSELFTFQDADGNAEDVSSVAPFTAELRTKSDHEAPLIATLTVDASDAANGNVTLSLTAAQTRAITEDQGWFDIVDASDNAMHDESFKAVFTGRPTDTS